MDLRQPDTDRFCSRRSTVYAPNGVVATSQPLAAEAGIEILRKGGNAFDAAVATAATLNVVEPTSTGLGGDVFALYRTSEGKVGAMRSCGGAPEDASLEKVRREVAEDDSEEDVRMPERGPHTVTVPGTARGWESTVEDLGELPLGDVLEPAIGYAKNGYPVTEVVAEQWEHAEDLFEDDHAREAYLFDGHPPTVGEKIKLENLGETLEKIAEHGADVFYEGDIAEKIVEEVRSKGGFLSTDDLSDFEPEFLEPVSTTYKDAEVYELPPNNQGLIALEALNIAEEIGAGGYEYGSADRIHYFAEAMKLAFHDGHHYITDPEYVDVPGLASKEYAERRAAEIDEEPLDADFGVPNSNAEDADTVLLTVADSEGNLVSYINSRFMGFGSGLVAGDTGVALQNRGASFSLEPEHPNRLEPQKRPFHTLIPAIADFSEQDSSASGDWCAFGVMGGYMQPQGHLQVISNIVDYQKPLQTALDEPRWRYLESGELGVEPGFGSKALSKLSKMGHDVKILPSGRFGGAQITRNKEGVLSGATEPRKDGNATGY